MDEYDDECAKNLLKKRNIGVGNKRLEIRLEWTGGYLSMRRQGKSSIPCGRYPLEDL